MPGDVAGDAGGCRATGRADPRVSWLTMDRRSVSAIESLNVDYFVVTIHDRVGGKRISFPDSYRKSNQLPG